MIDYYEIALKVEQTASSFLFFLPYKFYFYWTCIFLFGGFIALKFASMDEEECKKKNYGHRPYNFGISLWWNWY